MNLKKKKTDMMGREEEERDNMKALLDECLTWCIDCTMSPCICVLTKLELRIMQEKVAKMLDNLMKKTGCDTRTPSATTTTTTTSVGNDDEKEEITGKTRGKKSSGTEDCTIEDNRCSEAQEHQLHLQLHY